MRMSGSAATKVSSLLGQSSRLSFVPRLLSSAELPQPKRWLESKVWTPEGIVTSCPDAETSADVNVKRCRSRSFMYADSFSSTLLPDTQKDRVEVVSMSLSDLFQKTQKKDPDGWNYYYTHPVAQFAPSLLRSIPDWQDLSADPSPPHTFGRMLPYVSAWIGGPGVVTQAHYDVAANVFVQMYGRKRFRLYPPSAADALHLYPDAHPRARKSQVDFDCVDSDIFPKFKQLDKPYIDVILEPGDSLYIPPFWFHHVEALSASISLNVFSDSDIRAGASGVFATDISAAIHENDDKTTPEHKFAAIRFLASEVFRRLDSEGGRMLDPADFFESMYASRYKPLFQRGRDVHGHRESLGGSNSSVCAVDLDRNGIKSSLVEGRNLGEIADQVVENFAKMHGSVGDSENYTENCDEQHGLRLIFGLDSLILSHLVELWLVRYLGVSYIHPRNLEMLYEEL